MELYSHRKQGLLWKGELLPYLQYRSKLRNSKMVSPNGRIRGLPQRRWLKPNTIPFSFREINSVCNGKEIMTMKTKIIIEETITQEFEVEVSDDLEAAFDEIREKYKNGTLVVEDPNLIDAKVMILEDGEQTDWISLI